MADHAVEASNSNKLARRGKANMQRSETVSGKPLAQEILQKKECLLCGRYPKGGVRGVMIVSCQA
jgi:hypothetical protein